MKFAIFGALGLLAVVNASAAGASTYILVDSNGHERFLSEVPRDMSYPPANVRMPVYDKARGTRPEGTPLTAEQEQRRMNADMLIITDIPLTTPRNLSR